MRRVLRILSVAVGMSLAMTGVAHAGPILMASGASTSMGSYSGYSPSAVIDQSGLEAGYVPGVTDFDTYVPATATLLGADTGNIWFSPSDVTTGSFDFALGGLFDITSFALWTDPQNAGLGVKDFELYADDNAAFSSPTFLGTYLALAGPGTNVESLNVGQIFGFAPVLASNVRMQILSNYGGFVIGISEAAFEMADTQGPAPAPVPEPTSFLLLGTGIALIAVRLRQRKVPQGR
ncbi:MAG: PEP-CTERM sorting domain-containing protein [Vicinamibacterales bacterium]